VAKEREEDTGGGRVRDMGSYEGGGGRWRAGVGGKGGVGEKDGIETEGEARGCCKTKRGVGVLGGGGWVV